MKRAEIQAILASAGQSPRHQFGQNFMIDLNILAAIADAGDIQPDDIILEVGPGVGNLTRLLSQRAKAVLAVDIDTKLMAAAQRHHTAFNNVTWLNADVLSGKHEINPEVVTALSKLCSVGTDPQGATGLRSSQTRADQPSTLNLKLVSNLPYNAASPLIAELLVLMWSQRASKTPVPNPLPPFTRLAFTVQYEVGQRMAAPPNTSDYGPLGILIQLMADVKIIRKIPPGAFWPPPKIHSALVVVTPDPARIAAIPDAHALQRLLSGIFSHRRQKLSNGLKHTLDAAFTPDLAARLTAAGIDLSLRPETFTPTQFLTIANLVESPSINPR